MMKNKKPILIAGGCSWTEKDYVSFIKTVPDELRGPWPMWPELLGDRIGDVEVINTALSGSGNKRILTAVFNEIIEHGDDVEYVVIMWSDITRFDLGANRLQPSLNHYNREKLLNQQNRIAKHTQLTNSALAEIINSVISTHELEKNYIDHCTQVLLLNEYCKNKNIKLLMMSAFGMVNHRGFNEQLISYKGNRFRVDNLYRIILGSEHTHAVGETGTYWGWPVEFDLGGRDINNHSMIKNIEDGSIDLKCVIHDDDNHPNAYGQELLSENIFKIMSDMGYV